MSCVRGTPASSSPATPIKVPERPKRVQGATRAFRTKAGPPSEPRLGTVVGALGFSPRGCHAAGTSPSRATEAASAPAGFEPRSAGLFSWYGSALQSVVTGPAEASADPTRHHALNWSPLCYLVAPCPHRRTRPRVRASRPGGKVALPRSHIKASSPRPAASARGEGSAAAGEAAHRAGGAGLAPRHRRAALRTSHAPSSSGGLRRGGT